MAKRLTQKEYAEYKGVTQQAISQAIKSGRIPYSKDEKGKRFIDPDVADKAWDKNTDTAQQRKEVNQSTSPEAAPSSGPSFAKSRAVRETYQAKIAQLTYQQMAGELVDAREVKLQAYHIAKTVREALIAIPDRLAAILAAEEDEHKVHILMTDEINKALQELSRAGQS